MTNIFKPATPEEIKQRQEKYLSVWIAEFVKRPDITKNEDGSYDVDGNIELIHMNLTKIPVKFGRVTGHFNCSHNKLATLENSPEYVGDHFLCSFNNLITLENSPKYVGGYFWCHNNKLTTLKGCPEYVGGGFYCRNNPKLKSLEGIGKVKGQIINDIKK